MNYGCRTLSVSTGDVFLTVSSRMLTLRLLAALTVHNLLREEASSAHLAPVFVDTEGHNDRMISGAWQKDAQLPSVAMVSRARNTTTVGKAAAWPAGSFCPLVGKCDLIQGWWKVDVLTVLSGSHILSCNLFLVRNRAENVSVVLY